MIEKLISSATLIGFRWWVAFFLVPCLCSVLPATAQADRLQRETEAANERTHALLREAGQLKARLDTRLAQRKGSQPENADRLREALGALEHAMASLDQLGRHEELEMLRRITDGVRKELLGRGDRERSKREHRIAKKQIEVMKLAVPALMEAERVEGAQVLKLAIRAREVLLEGRRDQEARTIRARAPKRGQLVTLLTSAEAIYREFGLDEKAAIISRLTEQLWPDRDRPRAERDAGRRSEPQREAVKRQIEVMKMAVHALLEDGREDATDLLELAIHARELARQGRNDPEARDIRERAPNLAQQVEILRLAATLWREFGNDDKAEAVGELAERLWSNRDRPRDDRPARPRQQRDKPDQHEWNEHREAVIHRIELLQDGLAELHQLMDAIKEDLRALRQMRD